MRHNAHSRKQPISYTSLLFVSKLDVRDEATIKQSVMDALHRFGRIDAVVNNAGYALMGPVEAMEAADVELQFATNILGPIAVTRNILPYFREQKAGVVINVSSIGGRMAFPLASFYHATKYALEGFSESLRFELDPFGIRVKLVEPGGIRTNFIERGTQWGEHPAYASMIEKMKTASVKLNSTLPSAEGVAQIIYRAATDTSRRLRYQALPGPYLAVYRLLPDWLWIRLAGLAIY